MEKYKFENYRRETGNLFPEIESLNSISRYLILGNILRLLGLDKNSNLFVEIQRNLPYKDLEDENIEELSIVFREFDIKTTDHLFIVWNINDIDKFNMEVLIENWSFIWYGDSDDAIIVYDNKNSRILLITHYGRIYYH